MTVQNASELKEAVTVSEMASMCDLSRQRFHELIGIVFPYPVYLLSNRRPIYDRKLQEVCLRVRRTGRSINGDPVIFYQRRARSNAPMPRGSTKNGAGNHADLIQGLESLGLSKLNEIRISQVVQELFPEGTNEIDSGEVIRQVFLRLKCQDSV